MTHGSKSHRAHGSIGMSATPARVLPGGKHPGRMGNKMVKQRKLKVLEVSGRPGMLMSPFGLEQLLPSLKSEAEDASPQSIQVDAEMKAIVVKGSVPGKAGALVRITPAKIVGKNI